jgi:hypothetical protein
LGSFNKAKAQISDMKKDVEDKIAKCQSNTILEAISSQCEQILQKFQKNDDFKRL